MLTQAILRELIDYDPETGVLTYRPRGREWFKSDRSCKVWNIRFAGKVAGGNCGYGYLKVGLDGRLIRAHRLIWLWMTGEWPENQIDHINHVRDDNRWANLRSVTQQENLKNRTVTRANTSGIPGVRRENKKWRAFIGVAGRLHYLGIFSEKDHAIAARHAAETKYGFHPNHGRAA
jgi:hypothetical protein